MSKLSPGEAAILLSSYRACPADYHATSTLITKFNPIVEAIASRFPSNWREDLIQEGYIAIVNAAQKFPTPASLTGFLSYACKSIKRGMLYFYRSTITKMPERSIDSIELMAEVNEGDPVYEIAHPIDYETSITLGIDFKYTLSKNALAQQDFSEKEIRVFDLHFNQGYTVTEVAKEINLSTPQTSKIISKIKIKVQQLLA